jgi:hypothetical protein
VAVLPPLTVAAVRASEEGGHVEVLFLESARVYTLERGRADFEELLAQLREGRRVRVKTARPDSDVIEEMEVLPEPD